MGAASPKEVSPKRSAAMYGVKVESCIVGNWYNNKLAVVQFETVLEALNVEIDERIQNCKQGRSFGNRPIFIT